MTYLSEKRKAKSAKLKLKVKSFKLSTLTFRFSLYALHSLFLVSILSGCTQQPHFEQTRLLMGTFAKIEIFGKESELSRKAAGEAFAEIKRIEDLLSRYNPQSQLSQINENAGKPPVVVDREVLSLVKEAVEINRKSQGSFDITIAPVVKLWGFYQKDRKIPAAEEIKEALAKVGSDKILINEKDCTVLLKDGMELDLGGIGKGYAVDKAVDILRENKIDCALVNIGGNLKTLGLPKKGFWSIGIKDPLKKDQIITKIKIRQTAVSTSGSYENYFVINGKNYSHIIDPKSGFPADKILSVTILCDSAMHADALSTLVFVLGKEKSLGLLKDFGARAVIIDKSGSLDYTN